MSNFQNSHIPYLPAPILHHRPETSDANQPILQCKWCETIEIILNDLLGIDRERREHTYFVPHLDWRRIVQYEEVEKEEEPKEEGKTEEE